MALDEYGNWYDQSWGAPGPTGYENPFIKYNPATRAYYTLDPEYVRNTSPDYYNASQAVETPWTAPAVTEFDPNTLEGWGNPNLRQFGSAPNYAGAFAKALGMTPRQFDEWSAKFGYNSSPGLGQISNPFVAQQVYLDNLISERGLSGNPQVMAWRNALQGNLESGGQGYTSISGDDSDTGWAGISRALQGALFAIGTPLSLGTALTGIPAATALGGGLGADIIGAITNPAGSMGLSGVPASIVNTGIKQGIGSLLDVDGSRAVRLQSPSYSPSGGTNVQESVQEPEAVSTLAQDVVSPTQTTSLSAPQSLSSQVMTINKPRRPQIRLTEGFRRGQ